MHIDYLDKKTKKQKTKTNSIQSQLIIICSKSTRKTLEKVWNMFKVNNKNTRTASLMSFWWFYYQFWTYFTPFSSVSIASVMFAGVWFLGMFIWGELTRLCEIFNPRSYGIFYLTSIRKFVMSLEKDYFDHVAFKQF